MRKSVHKRKQQLFRLLFTDHSGRLSMKIVRIWCGHQPRSSLLWMRQKWSFGWNFFLYFTFDWFDLIRPPIPLTCVKYSHFDWVNNGGKWKISISFDWFLATWWIIAKLIKHSYFLNIGVYVSRLLHLLSDSQQLKVSERRIGHSLCGLAWATRSDFDGNLEIENDHISRGRSWTRQKRLSRQHHPKRLCLLSGGGRLGRNRSWQLCNASMLNYWIKL